MRCMNQSTFFENYVYALEHDFCSPTGEPAAWAPGYPKHWGQETARIQLEGKANALALSPDDKIIAVGIDTEIHVFNAETQERVDVLRGHTGALEQVEFAPKIINTVGSEGTRYVLVSTGEDIEESAGEGYRHEGSDFAVIVLWELDERGGLRQKEDRPVDVDTLTSRTLQPLISDLVSNYSWKRDEKAMEAIEQAMKKALRNAVSLHEQESKLRLQGELASFGRSTFSPDGKTMIYLSQNETTQHELRDPALLPCVNLWDMQSRSLRHRLLGHTDSIMWAGMSPDNTLVASIAWDGTARVWNANSGDCVHVFGFGDCQLWSGAFSPDSKYLAVSQGSPRTHIHVYDFQTGQSVSRFDGFRHWARTLAWSPDGTVIAAGGDSGTVRLWDPLTGEEQMQWRLAFEDPVMRSFAGIQSVQFVDGGRKLVFRTGEGTVETYDFQSNLKQQFTRGAGYKIDTSPEGRMAVSSDAQLLVVPDADGVLRLWNL
ncbi:WD40 repeat-like protein [Aspergillus eucalypticola CBS 122712]|uniref:WD40 repeat-like protein n=1 Tax=Aspergillus eucalypticola (strain CBS 122712 / IBT 29274) TaxID=1448314 RepID=A0A317W4E4_ASPEC|nr:WD40 repeat-like protein [Aspergillus eucalypticola CBS 122712]PWY81303.1 WD40 repeat-like protein [Aspergillus eucalypticola CBS 122712]